MDHLIGREPRGNRVEVGRLHREDSGAMRAVARRDEADLGLRIAERDHAVTQ